MFTDSVKYDVFYNTFEGVQIIKSKQNMFSKSTNFFKKKPILISTIIVIAFLIIIIIICSSIKDDPLEDTCQINPLDYKLYSPLLVHTEDNSLIYPKHGDSLIKLSLKESFELTCANKQIIANGRKFGSTITATCVSEKVFNINGENVNWKDISCSGTLTPNILKLSTFDLPDNDINKKCYDRGNNLVLGRIGYQLDAYRYLSIIDVCFDTKSRLTLYSHYNITNSIRTRATNVSRNGYKQDDTFYNMSQSLDQIYKNNKTTINNLLNLPSSSEKYFNKNFIDRGHLAARADFYYASLQTAVDRYINVAPQWRSFNGGNWRRIEESIRNYADRKKATLQIWTGTYGITSLVTSLEKMQQLYLYVGSSGYLAIPVPEVFWRIVYNPDNQNGIVIVGHNNPYVNYTRSDNLTICSDISSKVSWLSWKKDNITEGYSYACDYNDQKFQKLVPVAPQLTVKNLLI